MAKELLEHGYTPAPTLGASTTPTIFRYDWLERPENYYEHLEILDATPVEIKRGSFF